MNSPKKPHFKIDIRSPFFSRMILAALVVVLMIITIWISGPLPERDAEGMIITPTAEVIYNTQTGELKNTPDILETTPTSGVLVAGVGIVVIILVGTLITIKRQD